MRRLEKLESSLGCSGVAVGETSLTRTTGSARSPNVSAFTATWVNEHQHYPFARGLDRRPEGFEAVEIVTGSCLWSIRTMRGLGAAGAQVRMLGTRPFIEQRLEAFAESPRFSLYELENARRLARLIVDLVASLDAGVDVSIRIDVPGVAYYCYLLDAFGRGLVSRAQLLDWFARVDARRERVVALITGELRAWARCSGLDAVPKLDAVDGMLAVEGDIREGIDRGRVPAVGRLAGRFAGSDETWAAMLDVAEPRTVHDLIELAQARAMLQPTRGGMDARARLTLAVDDYSEVKIFQHAERLAARVTPEANRLMGLYPLPHVLTTTQGRHGPVFLQDPGGAILDTTGRELSHEELLCALYGRAALTEVPVLACA